MHSMRHTNPDSAVLLILLEDPNVDIIQTLPENVQKQAFPVFEYSI